MPATPGRGHLAGRIRLTVRPSRLTECSMGRWMLLLTGCLLLVAPLPLQAIFPWRSSGEPQVREAAQLAIGASDLTVSPAGSLIVAMQGLFRPPDRLIELTRDRTFEPYPTPLIGRNLDGAPIQLDSVQSVQVDGGGVVWILDNGRRSDTPPQLVGWNHRQEKLHRVIPLVGAALRPGSILEQLAVDGSEPFAYIADPASGPDAALLVVNLESGLVRRVLQGDYSVTPNPAVRVVVGGQELQVRRLDGTELVPSAGIHPLALDRRSDYLYYGPMQGNMLYRIATEHLRNEQLAAADLASQVERYAPRPPATSITLDNRGNVYVGDLAANAIGIIHASDKQYRIHVSDPRFQWPHGLCFGADGDLYFTASQLHLSAPYNRGEDRSLRPFFVFSAEALAAGTPGR